MQTINYKQWKNVYIAQVWNCFHDATWYGLFKTETEACSSNSADLAMDICDISDLSPEHLKIAIDNTAEVRRKNPNTII